MIDQPISRLCSNYYPLGIISQYPTGNLPAVCIGYHGQMDIYQIRLTNFRSAVVFFGSRKALAEKIDMAPNLLNQYIGKNPTKRIGDESARKLDAALGKSVGFTDIAGSVERLNVNSTTTNVAVDLNNYAQFRIDWQTVIVTGSIMPAPKNSTGNVELIEIDGEKNAIAVPNANETTRAYKIGRQGLGIGLMPNWFIALNQITAPAPNDIVLANPDSDTPQFGEYLSSTDDGHILLTQTGDRVFINKNSMLYAVTAILPPQKHKDSS